MERIMEMHVGEGKVRDWDEGRDMGKHRDKDGSIDLEERKTPISLYANCLIPILMSQYLVLLIPYMWLDLTFHHNITCRYF